MTLRLTDMFVINSECTAGMALHVTDNSIDAIVTDPPYGLSKEPDMTEVLRHWLNGDDYEHGGSGFMGKKWDSFVPGPSVWREAIRCLKPGGYALVFAGSRTQDLMTTSLRLAGFEIRDTAMWLYGSGFPKSLDVSKAIDKKLGVDREVIGREQNWGASKATDGKQAYGDYSGGWDVTAAGSPQAAEWNGYGTALKPAYEPIIIARKPLGGTVAETVLKHGTGAINIDGCRVGTDVIKTNGRGSQNGVTPIAEQSADYEGKTSVGRWPANILHDGLTEEWARYFYCAKTSKADRNAGCEHLDHQSAGEVTGGRSEGSAGLSSPRSGAGRTSGSKNYHPTVKPTDLMRWCCRLVGHPNALIMDPFSGSGSTGRGAALEGFGFIGFEMDPEYVDIANARISHAYSMLTR